MENGQPELLRELFSAPPNITAGRIAHDGLRQMKNMGICTATGVSRAAIQGGLDPEQAFCMSDLYIQKLELMRDVSNIERLMQEMMLDFAEQVEKMIHPSGSESQLYRMCAQYVSQNIFTSIRAECQTAHCGRCKPHFDFGDNTFPIVPYRHLPQTLIGMTADCRSLV